MIHVQQMKGGWSDGTHCSQLPRPMAQVAAVTCVPTVARGPTTPGANGGGCWPALASMDPRSPAARPLRVRMRAPQG